MSELIASRFWDNVKKTSGCWTWGGYTLPKTGYGFTRASTEGRKMLAHRAAWEIVRGPIPRGLFVLHSCDNPACVRPRHLFLGTQRDNMQDCSRKGRLGGTFGAGENSPKAKLTESQVREIRWLRGQRQQKTIALEYGVTAKTIGRIQRRESWGAQCA